MKTVLEIQEAIRKLSANDAWRLAEELRGYLDELWDDQFAEDVKSGRLDRVIELARQEHAKR